MDTIADRDLLTEGSVWIRENGKKNIVLLLTNRTLSAKLQKQFPPQIIYTDEAGNTFNQSVTNFLTTRTFLNVNPTMETRCLSLTMNMEEDGEFQSDDVLVLAEDDGEGEDEDASVGAVDPEGDSVIARFMAGTEGSATSVTANEVNSPNPIEFFPLNDASLPAAISIEALQEALASYEVAPNLERGQMVHTLSFRCEDSETANGIFKSFHGLNHATNLLYGFRVVSPANANGSEEVRWVASVGAYPYIVDGDNFIRVLVLTPSPVPVELPQTEDQGSQSFEAAEEIAAVEEVAEVPSDLLERVEAVIQAENAPAAVK